MACEKQHTGAATYHCRGFSRLASGSAALFDVPGFDLKNNNSIYVVQGNKCYCDPAPCTLATPFSFGFTSLCGSGFASILLLFLPCGSALVLRLLAADNVFAAAPAAAL